MGGEEDTEDEIARQVADLERELEEQDGMRSKLQEVYEAGAGRLVKQSGEAGQIESLVESASREARRRQEQVKAEVRSSSVCQPDSNTAAAWEERQLKTSSPINLAPALLPQPPYYPTLHFATFPSSTNIQLPFCSVS